MKLSDVKKLHQKKYRYELGHYLVEGEHLILELVKATTDGNQQAITLYITEQYTQWACDLGINVNIEVLSQKQMAQISDTKNPQGLVACVPMPLLIQPDNNVQGERSVYLYEVQDPGNLGTIIRTLAWFGDFRLLLSPNSVDPFNAKVVRASMGAMFHLPLELDVTLSSLPKRFDKFACLDLQGTPIVHPDFADFECYLFGNEARGVPREMLSALNALPFTIVGNGPIDSLNLATAVSISAYQLANLPRF